MNRTALIALLSAAFIVLPGVATAAARQGQGQALVTILPKNNEAGVNLQPQDLRLKVNGKDASVTSFAPARRANSPLELVLLIDSSARTSLGTQMSDIQNFVKEMPASATMTIGYMENGRAALSGPLSSNPAQVLNGLHLPTGIPGNNGSPYFCLSDLAQHWPSNNPNARREVVMVTDGVDYYNLRYDPSDPYVLKAISDSVRAGITVYSIYWLNQGRIDSSLYENNAGQNLLGEVTQATGGKSYWQGLGNPVSFDGYFKDLRHRFENQYRITFNTELKGKPDVQKLELKINGVAAKVDAPQQVFVSTSGSSGGE
jgi:hypothetical protein